MNGAIDSTLDKFKPKSITEHFFITFPKINKLAENFKKRNKEMWKRIYTPWPRTDAPSCWYLSNIQTYGKLKIYEYTDRKID